MEARVIGVVSSAAKAEAARRHGTEFVIGTGSGDSWPVRVTEITDGHGVDAIFDPVGQATFDGNFEAAARKATVVCFGNTSGDVPPQEIRRLMPKNLKLCTPTLFAYMATAEDAAKYTAELFQMISTGKVKVDIYRTYELADVAKAHGDLEGRKNVGKVMLRIS